ncbi:hypothetical protein GMORB2_5848 [Geosmithia morbida]|uniref:Uncharacterized protein n=1 Tax=Geosmithia morbida TaxID=1094350 RepID=A0A9P4YYI0_9HYPO|nr:uncharacterized protein GMORB2_5848 [Geosmithia morbida]KAF4124132.1 hypothetical protein GMORB2_5848 [Geosmithia morbida]
MAPSPAPHERTAPSAASEMPAPAPPARTVAATTSTTAAAAGNSPSSQRTGPIALSAPNASTTTTTTRVRSKNGPPPPKIVVKKEPGSPTMPNSRPRPSRLDLSKTTLSKNANGSQSARPLTARDPVSIQEMGIHCLSPGFVTDDPTMKNHIQRSMSVREQQRHIIEARLHQQSAKGDSTTDGNRESDLNFAAKTPGMSRRNKAPPGLSIVAPSHTQFSKERVIQSAPLGHSFTGRQEPVPATRHFASQAAHLSNSTHIHLTPANQTDNRLPPISDVFGQGLSAHHDNVPHTAYPTAGGRGMPVSPSYPPTASTAQQIPGRSREYKSAEEAQQDLAGGRPELLPKLVHYGVHQPPTPPSPAPGSRSTGKRRTRAEYEDGASPPLGHGPATSRRGPFGAGRDSPETQRQKRDEFLKLCERAWDLFHS